MALRELIENPGLLAPQGSQSPQSGDDDLSDADLWDRRYAAHARELGDGDEAGRRATADVETRRKARAPKPIGSTTGSLLTGASTVPARPALRPFKRTAIEADEVARVEADERRTGTTRAGYRLPALQPQDPSDRSTTVPLVRSQADADKLVAAGVSPRMQNLDPVRVEAERPATIGQGYARARAAAVEADPTSAVATEAAPTLAGASRALRDRVRPPEGDYSIAELTAAERAARQRAQAATDPNERARLEADADNLANLAASVRRSDNPLGQAQLNSPLGLADSQNTRDWEAIYRAPEFLDPEAMARRGVTGADGKPVSVTRGFDVGTDLGGAALGQAVTQAALSMFGKGLAAVASRETMGLLNVGDVLAGPRPNPAASFAENLPALARRGMVEGQAAGALGAFNQARAAHQDPAGATMEALGMGAVIGPVAEMGFNRLGAASRGIDRAARDIVDPLVDAHHGYRAAVDGAPPIPPELAADFGGSLTEAGAHAIAHDPAAKQSLLQRLGGVLGQVPGAVRQEQVDFWNSLPERLPAEEPAGPDWWEANTPPDIGIGPAGKGRRSQTELPPSAFPNDLPSSATAAERRARERGWLPAGLGMATGAAAGAGAAGDDSQTAGAASGAAIAGIAGAILRGRAGRGLGRVAGEAVDGAVEGAAEGGARPTSYLTHGEGPTSYEQSLLADEAAARRPLYDRPPRGREEVIRDLPPQLGDVFTNVEVTSESVKGLGKADLQRLSRPERALLTKAFVATVVRPILKSEGIDAVTEAGLGSWFSEGNFDVQHAAKLGFPKQLPPERVVRVLARISDAAHQAGLFVAPEDPNGPATAVELNFGRRLSDRQYAEAIERLSRADGGETFNGSTMVRLNPGVAQIVLNEGADEVAAQRVLDLARSSLPEYPVQGRIYQASPVFRGADEYAAEIAETGGTTPDQARVGDRARQAHDRLGRVVGARNRVADVAAGAARGARAAAPYVPAAVAAGDLLLDDDKKRQAAAASFGIVFTTRMRRAIEEDPFGRLRPKKASTWLGRLEQGKPGKQFSLREVEFIRDALKEAVEDGDRPLTRGEVLDLLDEYGADARVATDVAEVPGSDGLTREKAEHNVRIARSAVNDARDDAAYLTNRIEERLEDGGLVRSLGWQRTQRIRDRLLEHFLDEVLDVHEMRGDFDPQVARDGLIDEHLAELRKVDPENATWRIALDATREQLQSDWPSWVSAARVARQAESELADAEDTLARGDYVEPEAHGAEYWGFQRKDQGAEYREAKVSFSGLGLEPAGHFANPGLLGWARTETDGKVRTLIEVQSDYASKGRKQGFKTPKKNPPSPERIAELKAEAEALRWRHSEARVKTLELERQRRAAGNDFWQKARGIDLFDDPVDGTTSPSQNRIVHPELGQMDRSDFLRPEWFGVRLDPDTRDWVAAPRRAIAMRPEEALAAWRDAVAQLPEDAQEALLTASALGADIRDWNTHADALAAEIDRLAEEANPHENPDSRFPDTPFREPEQWMGAIAAHELKAALDDGINELVIPSPEDFASRSSLPIGKGTVLYGQTLPRVFRRMYGFLGLNPDEYISHEPDGVHIQTGPAAVRKAAKTVGIPLMGLLAMTATADEARAAGVTTDEKGRSSQSLAEEGGSQPAWWEERGGLAVGAAVAAAGGVAARTVLRDGLPAALKDLASRGVLTNPVVLGALGALMQQVPDEEYQDFGRGVVGLAALKSIGAERMRAGAGAIGRAIVAGAKATGTEGLVRAFNPDALLTPEVRETIRAFERSAAKGKAKAGEWKTRLAAHGPEVNRAVTDAVRGETWEGPLPPTETALALSLAAELVDEMEALGIEKVGAGVISEAQYDASGGAGYLPRVYAEHEAELAAPALGSSRSGPGGGQKSRVTRYRSRTLDEPVRVAEAALAEARASGNAQEIADAEAALDDAIVRRDAAREHLGEIRESSYLASYALERGWRDVGAAKLLDTLLATPGTVHPDWLDAYQATLDAHAMLESATDATDRQAARELLAEAREEMRRVSDHYSVRRGDWVALPPGEGLGPLAGAVVQRDVALSVEGLPDVPGVTEAYRLWKTSKTVWNPGTHAANTVSNAVMLHMAGLSIPRQLAWMPKAVSDLAAYGPATKALAEAGVLDTRPLDTRAAGVGRSRMGPKVSDLVALKETTAPHTRAALDRQNIKGIPERLRDAGQPGAARAAELTGAGAGKVADVAHATADLYANEDNVYRVLAYQWARSPEKDGGLGLAEAAALRFARDELIDFRTRSPALHVMRNSFWPFILYTAKALPKFAEKIVDHPERWVTAAAFLLAVNEYGEEVSGRDFQPGDVPARERSAGYGPLAPDLVQLPLPQGPGRGAAALDFTRWTPGSAVFTGAPRNQLAAQYGVPQGLSPTGPLVDWGAALATNKDSYGRPVIDGETPLGRLGDGAVEAARQFLPTAATVHVPRLVTDVLNRDPIAAANDAAGLLGARPRYFTPGAGILDARRAMEDEQRAATRELESGLRRARAASPERKRGMVDRATRRLKGSVRRFQKDATAEP